MEEKTNKDTTCSVHVEEQFLKTAEVFAELQEGLQVLEEYMNNLKVELDKRPKLGRSNQLFLTETSLKSCIKKIHKRNESLRYHIS